MEKYIQNECDVRLYMCMYKIRYLIFKYYVHIAVTYYGECSAMIQFFCHLCHTRIVFIGESVEGEQWEIIPLLFF